MIDEQGYIQRVQIALEDNPEMFDGLDENAYDNFMRWLPDNYHVLRAFGRYALMLREKGRRDRYSAYTIRERLRWDTLISEVGTEYKISNNHTPFIARLIMKITPALDGLFTTKNKFATTVSL